MNVANSVWPCYFQGPKEHEDDLLKGEETTKATENRFQMQIKDD